MSDSIMCAPHALKLVRGEAALAINKLMSEEPKVIICKTPTIAADTATCADTAVDVVSAPVDASPLNPACDVDDLLGDADWDRPMTPTPWTIHLPNIVNATTCSAFTIDSAAYSPSSSASAVLALSSGMTNRAPSQHQQKSG